MKIVSAAALLALANFASAGQVSNEMSNENIRNADTVLKEHAKIDAAAERAGAADDIGDACEAKTEVLSLCFEDNNEPDGAACFQDCAAPAAEAFDKCDDYCNFVEQCRRGKCSSGPSCASPYYDVLNCILEDDEDANGCTCNGSLDLLEETPAVEVATEKKEADEAPATEEEAVDDDEWQCGAETQDLIKCFDKNEEAVFSCLVDCVEPASESFASCDGFCASVEQCRSEKCSSGSACAAQYQKLLECVLEGSEGEVECFCPRSFKLEEPKEVATEKDSYAVPSTEEAEEDVCADEMQVVSRCFDKHKEANSAGCWEECTITAFDNFDTCESFCAAVETCRGEKCSSGSACAGSYYNVLNCAMATDDSDEKCTCSGAVEADETAEGSCASGDAAGTCAEA